ncbi:hypothetical protein [Sphingobium sp. YC-XJ3]|uniref:hypothetical protein n=1 Tax=Sphingobium sp. YC-XJ3 TaxID=3024245 RepID=UPI002362ED6D|nr:hypothetical protein [Sphingobium sp. YC-XJ3]WDA36451.1 hypothetical protein PO876_23980 [Sphingobium sp. YC-XJ3]WDA37819.1 hypothetical protein PO876_06470 [Sphingobium sp. YC-XJ3]
MSMVEAMAMAIWGGDSDEWATLAPWYADQYRDYARAALKALREPTPEMVEAGEHAAWDSANSMPAIRAIPSAWQAMIDAALDGEG